MEKLLLTDPDDEDKMNELMPQYAKLISKAQKVSPLVAQIEYVANNLETTSIVSRAARPLTNKGSLTLRRNSNHV